MGLTLAQARSAWVARRLTDALQQHRLQAVYQPVVHLATREVFSLEVLCRWTDEELGPVSPNEFIDVAEAHGLVVALGEFMLGQVLADLPAILHRWPCARVAINVSGVELSHPTFASRLIHTVHAVHAHWTQHLELEVTESAFHLDMETIRTQLAQVRSAGIGVAIDDFGTGQSTLSRLHQLPFSKIKLDRSFVLGLDDPMVQALVKAMAQLAHQFSRQLVVEGVETAAQAERLHALGCQAMQGYLVSCPLPLQALLARADLR